jgi:hypothetical protein
MIDNQFNLTPGSFVRRPLLAARRLTIRDGQQSPRSLVAEFQNELRQRGVPEIGVVVNGEFADAIDIDLDLPLPHGLPVHQRTLDKKFRHDFPVQAKAEF